MKSRYLQQGMYAAVFTVAAVQVNAASPVDFSNLVEQVSPAVVSVNVVKKMTQEELLQQQVPEILRRFLVIKSLFLNNKGHKKKLHTVVRFLLVKMVISLQTTM
jgi:serine protease Do